MQCSLLFPSLYDINMHSGSQWLSYWELSFTPARRLMAMFVFELFEGRKVQIWVFHRCLCPCPTHYCPCPTARDRGCRVYGLVPLPCSITHRKRVENRAIHRPGGVVAWTERAIVDPQRRKRFVYFFPFLTLRLVSFQLLFFFFNWVFFSPSFEQILLGCSWLARGRNKR